MSLETMRIAVLARRLVSADPATADTWYRFQEALDAGWFGLASPDRATAMQRVKDGARASIAASLRRSGFDPSRRG